MSENSGSAPTPADSAGGPASPESTAASGAPKGLDGSYTKAIRKGELKVDPKLGPSNYLTWAEDMQWMLEARRLWRHVSGNSAVPDKTSRPTDYEEWSLDDAQAKVWIRMNCEKSQHSHIRNKRTSKEAWDALKKVHGIQAKGRINLLLKRFHTYKASSDESIDDVASALENLKVEIGDIKPDHEPPNSLVAIALMSAIDDPAYNTAKFMLEQESDLTLEVAKEQLKAVQQKLKDDVENEVDNAHRADRAGAKDKSKPRRKCSHCGKIGHSDTYCWDWLDNTEEGQEWERTHPEQRRKPKNGTTSNSPKPTTDNSPKPKPTPSKATNSSKSRAKNQGTARTANEDGSDKSESEDDGWMAIDDASDIEETIYTAEDAEIKAHGWMLDSGASRHMTYLRDIFTKYTPYRTAIRIANGQRIWSEGKGNISIKIDGIVIPMTDVVFVPRLDANLLSISALNRKELNVLFHQDGVEILKRGTSVATGFLQGRTYFLKSSQVALKALAETSATAATSEKTKSDTGDFVSASGQEASQEAEY